MPPIFLGNTVAELEQKRHDSQAEGNTSGSVLILPQPRYTPLRNKDSNRIYSQKGTVLRTT